MMVPLGPQSEAQSAEVCFLWVATEAVWLSVVRQRLWGVPYLPCLTYSNYLALHRCGGLKSHKSYPSWVSGKFHQRAVGRPFPFPTAHVPRLGHHTVPWPHCVHTCSLGRWAPVEFVGHLRFTCVSNPCSIITYVVYLHGAVDLVVTLQGPWALSLRKCRHGAPNHSTPNFPLTDYCLLEVLLAGKAVVLLSIREQSYTLSAMIRAFCVSKVPTLTPPG